MAEQGRKGDVGAVTILAKLESPEGENTLTVDPWTISFLFWVMLLTLSCQRLRSLIAWDISRLRLPDWICQSWRYHCFVKILPRGLLLLSVELYLEHTEPASKEVGTHTQSPLDLPSSWPHKSALFPVWYVSLLDSILHFPVGSAPRWISPSLSKRGLVLEPHSTACGVSFTTVVVFLVMMAQVCLPECWCYSCLFSFPTYSPCP